MKKAVFIIIIMLVCTKLFAQNTADTLPPYLKVPFIPPFKILLSDSSSFTKDDLPKNVPVVIIYFSPDCGHCQIQVKEMADSMSFAKNVFFVLASYKPVTEIAEFEKHYQLNQFSNVKIGRDTKYFIPSFYKVKFTLFVAVYNKKGKLAKAFEHGFSIKALQELL